MPRHNSSYSICDYYACILLFLTTAIRNCSYGRICDIGDTFNFADYRIMRIPFPISVQNFIFRYIGMPLFVVLLIVGVFITYIGIKVKSFAIDFFSFAARRALILILGSTILCGIILAASIVGLTWASQQI